MDYAKENSLIDRDYGSIVLTDCETVVQIFANLLSADEYPATNADIAFGGIGRASHPSAIRKQARAGIVEGSKNASGQLVYKTDDPITRAEIAAIVTRIADSSLRLDAGHHTLDN